jgi:hypothetical protein
MRFVHCYSSRKYIMFRKLVPKTLDFSTIVEYTKKVPERYRHSKKRSDDMATLEDILHSSYIAEAYYDGYTVGVREDEENWECGYTVYIQTGAMPPHFSQFCRTLDEVDALLRTSFLPVDHLKWEAVEEE